MVFSADALPETRMGLSIQGGVATAEPSSVPFADGGLADLEFECDSFLVEFECDEEFSGFEAAFLELRFGQSIWFPWHDLIPELITLKMPTSVNADSLSV